MTEFESEHTHTKPGIWNWIASSFRANVETSAYIVGIVGAILVFNEYQDSVEDRIQSNEDRRRELAAFVWTEFNPKVTGHEVFFELNEATMAMVVPYENNGDYPVNTFFESSALFRCGEQAPLAMLAHSTSQTILAGGRGARTLTFRLNEGFIDGIYVVVAAHQFENPLGNEFIEKTNIEMIGMSTAAGATRDASEEPQASLELSRELPLSEAIGPSPVVTRFLQRTIVVRDSQIQDARHSNDFNRCSENRPLGSAYLEGFLNEAD